MYMWWDMWCTTHTEGGGSMPFPKFLQIATHTEGGTTYL